MRFEETTKNKFRKEEICGSMIYFLIKNDEVIYVGQSKNGMNRISFHQYTEKDFDNFCFINCNVKQLDQLENYYIIKYQPKYNKFLNKENANIISYSDFYYQKYDYSKAPRLPFSEAKEEIIKNKLYKTKFKKIVYLNINDLNKINDFLLNVSLRKKSLKEVNK